MSLLFLTLTCLIMTSLLFIISMHPLSLGMLIIFHTLLVCLSSSLTSWVTWLSYILFLVYLGAVMVLFSYVASLAANEQFHRLRFQALLPSVLVPSFIAWDTLLFPSALNQTPHLLNSLQPLYSSTSQLAVIFSPPFFSMTLFMAAYLLLTLLAVVYMSSKNTGPLRTANSC